MMGQTSCGECGGRTFEFLHEVYECTSCYTTIKGQTGIDLRRLLTDIAPFAHRLPPELAARINDVTREEA